ncbi:MAG: Nramp family divalent metal transporter, partial [candidate division NC10 bacterium]|nr:Nramp family divalent metal transporter [candidate division NC10 bacterium]
MPHRRKLSRQRILFFLALIGPGIITASVDNDAGGIATYSIAGAHYGYALLWTLIPITVALIVIQEMAARMGAVTGKGLADLIRENFGIRATFYLMFALFLTNLGNTMAEFAGWAAAMEIFGVKRYFSLPVGAFFVWWLVVKGSYKAVEKVFLTASAIYFTYVISAVLSRPSWETVFSQILIPEIQWDATYIMMLIGMVGTTIAPWMQFYLQSAVVEKGIKAKHYKASRWDVILGCLVTDLVALCIIVACAGTLFKHRIPIEDAKDAALALAPLAGKYASTLFAIGLANASLFSASILPLATAYYICEGMGWEGGISKSFREAPQFFWIYTLLIVLGAGVIFFPQVPLVPIMYLSQ